MAIEIKQSEAKTLTFTVTDSSGDAVSLSGATLSWQMWLNRAASAAVVTKTNTDFGTGSAASGIVTLALDADDTNQTAGQYISELNILLSASNIDKSADIDIFIIKKLF